MGKPSWKMVIVLISGNDCDSLRTGKWLSRNSGFTQKKWWSHQFFVRNYWRVFLGWGSGDDLLVQRVIPWRKSQDGWVKEFGKSQAKVDDLGVASFIDVSIWMMCMVEAMLKQFLVIFEPFWSHVWKRFNRFFAYDESNKVSHVDSNDGCNQGTNLGPFFGNLNGPPQDVVSSPTTMVILGVCFLGPNYMNPALTHNMFRIWNDDANDLFMVSGFRIDKFCFIIWMIWSTLTQKNALWFQISPNWREEPVELENHGNQLRIWPTWPLENQKVGSSWVYHI